MSSVAVVPPPGTTGWSHGNLEACTDEELLHQMWQQAEDFGERRRIRARMYKLKEQRLREMMQNDDEALGALTYANDNGTGVTERTETTITVGNDGTTTTTRRSSNIQITMNVDGEKASTESISTENVRLGGITLRGVDSISTGDSAADAIINERIRKASQDRSSRYQTIMDQYDHENRDPVVSITKSTFSIQTGALAGQGYHAMKNKEVRDSVSPTRIVRERRSSTEDDFSANEGRLTSDDEAVIKAKNEILTKALNNTKISRKSSREERNSTLKSTRLSRQSEIPIRNEETRKVSARKNSKELDVNSSKRTTNEKLSPTSPKLSSAETTTKTQVNRKTTTATTPSRLTQKRTETKTTTKSSNPTRKSKMAEIAAKMDSSIKSEMKNLGNYINTDLDEDDEIINEEEEEVIDESGNIVKMIRQTRKKKDGTEFVARNIATSTKVVSNESDIDEILIGNPDHEIIERNVTEELDEDGGKIKIITETRKREDGIEYTTKNVLKTSKIFDFDHPEDIAHDEEDELISSNQTEETDETGTTIQTVIETRRKSNGTEYTTKKVYKTCKVSTQITPSEDDEVIDTKEEEEKQDDGSIVRTLIETRRTKDGQEYTHRQVFKTRRMTLTGVELQQGIPMMQNNDEIIDKKEKEEIDSNGMNAKVVTETRKRKDGSTYTFEYVLRSFKGTKEDVQKMPYGGPGGSNIPVNVEDEIISEEVKEDVQEDGSTVKTIIERRRAKDGTQYLRHRILRIPKMPEPVLQIASLEDEILKEEKNEEVLDDGTQCRAITERRRSSVSGLQYTLRRTSKVYQQPSHRPTSSEDEIMDENVTEEETDDGSIIKTIIKRFQRPDGSIYNTHHVLKTFESPRPVKFIGMEDDELIDQSISEKETEDGYIVKTINETRCRADGVQYTVERTETTSQHCAQVHITLTDDAKDAIHVGSPDDVLISREEQEEDGEDGVNIKTVTEVRRTGEGSEYKTKTVVRSTPVLVPDHETSFVVIKPDDGVEEGGFAPSMDDELIYTRKKEETDENGQTITIIIETRQSKATGEKYNITKKVHTKDVVLTPEGEKEIPKELYKTTKIAVLKGVSASNNEPEDVDDTPYGSVSALKNRFASPHQDKELEKDKSSTPDKTNTLNRKKFFEEAAKQSQPTSPSSPKSVPNYIKTKEISTENQTDSASIEVKLCFNQDEASVEDVTTQNVIYQAEDNTLESGVVIDKAEVETYIVEEDTNLTEHVKEVSNDVLNVDVNETEITEKADEIMRESVDTVKESDLTIAEVEHELVPSLDDEVIYTRKKEETDTHGQIIIILIETRMSKLTGNKYNLTRQFLKEEYEAEFGSLTQQENETKRLISSKKQTPTTQKSKNKTKNVPENENKTKRDLSPRKKPEQDDKIKRTPISSRKAPSKDISSTTRTTPVQRGREPSASKDPMKRITRPSPSSSPARISSSPHRGRSPLRSGTSTPREGTPTGRQCCQRHRDASAAAAEEQVSPTRAPKVPSRVTQPVRKVKSPDEKTKMNGEIRTRLKTEDKVSNARKKFEKPNETPRSSRITQSSRKPQVSRSPDKKETTKTLPAKQIERKNPVKTTDKISTKTRPSDFLEQGGKTLTSSLDVKPVVTMPETPLTDSIKQEPIETSVEEGPVIEDVSTEPDHPYLKVQRPSLVREPSELPEDISEIHDSTVEESTDNSDVFMDNYEQQLKEPVIEDITKNEGKEEKPKTSNILEKRLSDKNISNKDLGTKKKENDNKQFSDKKKPFDRKSSETKSLTGKPEEEKKFAEKKRLLNKKPSDDKLRKQKDEPKRAINKKPFDRKPSDEKIVKKKDEKSLKKRLTESEAAESKNNTYEHKENLKNEQMSLESQIAQSQSVVSETAVSKTDLTEITDEVTTDSEVTVIESSSSEIYKKAEEMSTQLIEDVERSIASQIISEDAIINSEVETVHLDEIEASISDVQSNVTCLAKEDLDMEIKSSVKEEMISKSKNEQKTMTTKEVNSRKALFDQRGLASEKKGTPRRKPSYEMKDSVNSRKSMFEQPKQSSVPSPIRKPALKSSNIRGNNKHEQKIQPTSELKEEKKQENIMERKPVEEDIIVPKTAVVLGDKDGGESNKLVVGEIKEDKPVIEEIKEDSVYMEKVEDTVEKVDYVSNSNERNDIITTESKATFNSSEDLESREISICNESSLFTESQTNLIEEQLYSDTNLIKERSKSPSSREGSQDRDSKEGSPAPFSKDGSPSRFATGKPVDHGVNSKKVRRVERASSSKKLYEDLEVSKENLPSIITSIETIFEVSTLEQMMEKAETYEERRIIRGQLRLAKRPAGSTTKINATTATPTYKRFVDSTTSRVTPTSSPSLARKAEVKQETKTKESTKKTLSSSEKSVSNQNLESEAYEPTDTSGQPLFGIGALRKTVDKDSSTASLKTNEVLETTSSRLEEEVSQINESKYYRSSEESKYSSQANELEKKEENINITTETEKSNNSSHKTEFDTIISEDDRLSNVNEDKMESNDSEILKKDTNINVMDFKKLETDKESKTHFTAIETVSESSTADVYNEPLRHQKGNSRIPPRKEEQSDVDKIVSPYGCGPTDENGLPLFGLRALKRRTPTSTDLPLMPSETSPCEKVSEVEPTDFSGRPLFGLKALKKSQDELLESQELNETSTNVSSSSRTSYSTSYARRDEVDEGGQEREEEKKEEKESSEDSHSSSESSDEVTEPQVSNESPREKPKAKLRDFEATDLHDTKNTWDLESDLSTRSQDVKHIINKHETISVSETSEKKLTGILKKTSTSSMSGSVECSLYAEKSTNESTMKQLNSTNDILDTLTEDQINALSAEFDLRAQDDGVIKNKDSLEKLNEDINITGTTSEMTSPEERELIRKTSYTEIKLSQPSSQEKGTTTDVVSHSESYDSNDCKDIYISDSHNAAFAVEETKTTTTEIIKLTSESRNQSNLESISLTSQSTEMENEKDSLEISVVKESLNLTKIQAVNVKRDSESFSDNDTSKSKSEYFSIQTEKFDSEVASQLETEEQPSSSKKNESTKSKVSAENLENKTSINVDINVKECKNADSGTGINMEKGKKKENKKDQTKDKDNDMKGKKTVNTNITQTKNLLKEKKKQLDTKTKAGVNIIREKKNVNTVDRKQSYKDSKLKKQEKMIETKVNIKTKNIDKNKKEECKLIIKKEIIPTSSDISHFLIPDPEIQKEKNKEEFQNLDTITRLEKIEVIGKLKLIKGSEIEGYGKSIIDIEKTESLIPICEVEESYDIKSENNKKVLLESVPSQHSHDTEVTKQGRKINEDFTINETVESYSDTNTHEIMKSQLETKEIKFNDEMKELTVDIKTNSVNRYLLSESNIREISPERTASKTKIPKIKTDKELENRVKKISATCDIVLEERINKASLLKGNSMNASDKIDKKIANKKSKENNVDTFITTEEESEKNTDGLKEVQDNFEMNIENLRIIDNNSQVNDANHFGSSSLDSTLKVSTETTVFDSTSVSQETLVEIGTSMGTVSHEKSIESEILLDIKLVKERTVKMFEKEKNYSKSNSKFIDKKEEIKSNEKKDEEAKNDIKLVSENIFENLFESEQKSISEIEEKKLPLMEAKSIRKVESSSDIHNIKNDTVINELQFFNQSTKGVELKDSMIKTTELLMSVSEKLEKRISEVCEESIETKEKELNNICKNSDITTDEKKEKQKNEELYSKQGNNILNEVKNTELKGNSINMEVEKVQKKKDVGLQNPEIIRKGEEQRSVLSEEKKEYKSESFMSSRLKTVSNETVKEVIQSNDESECKQKEKNIMNTKPLMGSFDPHQNLDDVIANIEVNVLQNKKDIKEKSKNVKLKPWIGPLDFDPTKTKSNESEKEVKYIKRSSISKTTESSVDSSKRNKDLDNYMDKKDEKLEMVCAVTNDVTKSTEAIETEIIIKESNEVKLVTKDVEAVGEEIEINLQVPSNLNEGKNEAIQLQSTGKDYVDTSLEKLEENSITSAKRSKERNITLKDITKNEKPSETKLSKAVSNRIEIKKKNKAEKSKVIGIYSKAEEKNSKINPNKDKINKLTPKNRTLTKKSTYDKKSLIEENNDFDIDNKTSIKKEVEQHEDLKKPEYSRQMSLGTQIKKMARSNSKKKMINFNKTKNVEEVFEENDSMMTSEDKHIEVSNNETIKQINDDIISKEATEIRDTEDTTREDIKECEEIRIQNISFESKSAESNTKKEMKESQSILTGKKQHTSNPINEDKTEIKSLKSSIEGENVSNQELKERNVTLTDIIGSKNNITKGKRKSNEKVSRTAKKVINNKNNILQDILGTKNKSSKSLQLDPSIQTSKQQNAQSETLIKKKVTDRKSTKSVDEILTCNTTPKFETPSAGKDASKNDTLNSTSKFKHIKLQENKVRKTSSDTHEKKGEKKPWVGPLDVDQSCRKYSTEKKLSIDKDSLISSTERNTYLKRKSSVDEKQVNPKRSESNEAQNRRKRRETIDSKVLKERSSWVGPLDPGQFSRKSSVDRKYSSDNYSRKHSSERKWSAEKIKRSDSAQSLSGLSTTSSTPSYMRPRGSQHCRRSSRTPERDQKDVDEVLRNSQIYTRCTKRGSTPPVKYDYTHALIPDVGGGGGTYSVYFGPKDRLPDEYSHTSPSRSCSRASNRSQSVSPERELIHNYSVEEKVEKDLLKKDSFPIGTGSIHQLSGSEPLLSSKTNYIKSDHIKTNLSVDEESEMNIEISQTRNYKKFENCDESKSTEKSDYIKSPECLTEDEDIKNSTSDNKSLVSDSQLSNQIINISKYMPENKETLSTKCDIKTDQRQSSIHNNSKQDIEFVGTSSEHQESRNTDTSLTIDTSIEKSSGESSIEHRSSSRVVETSNSATVESSSNEMRVEATSNGRSFLDDRSKVSGVTDILSRMSATEAVDHEKKITSDDQARSLLNRFLGAQVLMTGVESMMAAGPNQGEQSTSSSAMSSSKTMQVRSEIDNAGRAVITHEASGQSSQLDTKDGKITKESSKSFSTGPVKTTATCKAPSEPVLVCGVNISEVTEDVKLNQLLDSCEEYEDRRKVRMRLKALMAEKKALREELSGHDLGSKGQGTGAQESRTREVQALSTTSNTKQSNLRSTEVNVQKSSYSTSSTSSNTQSFRSSSKQSAFDKFKQLDSNNPRKANPFSLTLPIIRHNAVTVKKIILDFCKKHTTEYEDKGVKIENFSTSWNDGMAFCALIHHFYPEAFDFNKLDPKNRRYNFDLAFRTADEKAGVMALLDVDDMVAMKKPDWKCVFTYVQALYKKLG